MQWSLTTQFPPEAWLQSCQHSHMLREKQSTSSSPSSLSARCRYDERLRRWGGDKQTHAYELAANSFEFFVVPLASIVHQPHEPVNSWSQDKSITCVGR